MKILLVGSGGREHAIAWKLSQSRFVKSIYVAPGNAGTEMTKKCCNIDLHTNDELLTFAKENKIDLTIIGPEKPLVEGIVDLFKKNGLNIFGPSKQAAQLEGSKIFAKNFMQHFKVSTAQYKTFINSHAARAYLKKASFPLVIKADGLAAGKGVEICKTLQHAEDTINNFMINNVFKGAGKSVVIEEYLEGTEASIICVTDTKTIIPLISAQDHKTIFEHNRGPNTGGMGAVCPNIHVNKKVMEDFIENIMNPSLDGIKKSKLDFHGFIFFGVMITKNGCKCLEYNVRMGDPECQSIVALMNFDLFKMFDATIKNQLTKFIFNWKKQTAINVVLTSKGYPGKFRRGDKITIKNKPLIFYAGVANINGQLVTNGGRVLSVVAIDKEIKKTYKRVYAIIKNIHFDGMYYRKDIGLN